MFPHGLSADDRIKLVETYCQKLADRYNVLVDVSIHNPHTHLQTKADKNGKVIEISEVTKDNHHAHILLSSREILPNADGSYRLSKRKNWSLWATSERLSKGIQAGISIGNTAGKPQANMNGLGYGKDSDNQTSITRSGITGIAGNSGITTDNRAEYAGILENSFDANRINEELGAQMQITQAFDQERRKVKTELNAKEQKLRKDAEEQGQLGNTTARDKLIEQADNVQNQGLLFDAISGAIYGPNSNGATGYVAKAVSPYVANQIGTYFKANEAINSIDGGTRSEQGSAAHLLAHTLLGAAVSYATGNDALTGGLSAGAGEASAPLLSKYLYGTDKPSELTAEQKDTVSAITSIVGATIGATTGNASDAANAAETNKVAVEDNHLNYKDTLARESWKSILEGCKGSQSQSCMLAREEILKLNAKDAFQREALLAACSNPTSANCTAAKAEALAIYKDLSDAARPKGANSAFGKEKNEIGSTLSSLPTGTITAI